MNKTAWMIGVLALFWGHPALTLPWDGRELSLRAAPSHGAFPMPVTAAQKLPWCPVLDAGLPARGGATKQLFALASAAGPAPLVNQPKVSGAMLRGPRTAPILAKVPRVEPGASQTIRVAQLLAPAKAVGFVPLIWARANTLKFAPKPASPSATAPPVKAHAKAVVQPLAKLPVLGASFSLSCALGAVVLLIRSDPTWRAYRSRCNRSALA